MRVDVSALLESSPGVLLGAQTSPPLAREMAAKLPWESLVSILVLKIMTITSVSPSAKSGKETSIMKVHGIAYAKRSHSSWRKRL